ncbi:sulfotransferase family protein [Yunchengibacter salinarum]|uniref:sulfotransferase family protein n=1 Tax=Yunchengibacter salinarum TaxID=3133399 RepID=UPI0035B58390
MGAPPNEPDVVFIGGTGRCGTSILRTVLGEQPGCTALPFEHRFLIDPDGLVDFMACAGNIWSPYHYDRRLKRLHAFLMTLAGDESDGPPYRGWELDRHFPGFRHHAEQLIDRLTAFRYPARWVGGMADEGTLWFAPCPDADSLLTACRAFAWATITGLLEKTGARVYVEDNTFNLLHAPWLHALFPSARFVHVVRHPFDVVRSFQAQRWCPDDLDQAIAFYRAVMDRILRQTESLPKACFVTQTHEAFTGAPAATIHRLARQLGLPDTTGDHTTAVHHRPAADIPPDDRARMATALAPYLDRFGYDA